MVTKKPTSKAAPISDVEEPGKSAASATSKPVIVTNRPLIKDPMVVEEADDAPAKEVLPSKKTSTKPKLQPLKPTADKPDTEQPEPVAEPASKTEASEQKAAAPNPNSKQKPSENDEKNAEKRKAEHDTNLQKIVDAKTYYLPINAVEKRKTKRFVLLGVLLSILLIMLWIDIALDAGLIQIDGITPITSFF